MKLLRTILFFFWMWIVLLVSILLLLPLKIMDFTRLKKIRKRYIHNITTLWARHLIYTSGSKTRVYGLENVPNDRSFCIVANHQSNFDIPLIVANIPRNIGFIGKHEMRKVPFLSSWMKALNCIFIKRDDLRHSINGLKDAVEQVNKGNPMVLFPEGTRSRSEIPGKFHPAGIRMAIEKGLPILPVTIKNSYKMYEQNNRIIPLTVEIMIHPLQLHNPENVSMGVSQVIMEVITPLSD